MRIRVLNTVDKLGIETDHTYLGNEESDTIIIMFPGGNNTCDRPILHFVRKAMIIKKYSVLCVSYTNFYIDNNIAEESIDGIVNSIDYCLETMIDKKFDRVIFIGQSIGNVIASRLIKLNHMDIDKRVFISPVRKSFDDTIKHCDMVITGTKDKHLSDDDRQKLKKIVTGKLMIVEGADHSLEAEGIIDNSLEICMNVVKAIDDYVG